MNLETRFKVNEPTVTHETIEGESVIINLESGNYYSLQGTGAEIWASVARNASVVEIVEDLSRRYSGIPIHIEECVTRLLFELQSEQLIVSNGVRGKSNKGSAMPIVTLVDKPDFQMPQLQKFTDMQELLLLDPIHEVDAAGWPSARRDP